MHTSLKRTFSLLLSLSCVVASSYALIVPSSLTPAQQEDYVLEEASRLIENINKNNASSVQYEAALIIAEDEKIEAEANLEVKKQEFENAKSELATKESDLEVANMALGLLNGQRSEAESRLSALYWEEAAQKESLRAEADSYWCEANYYWDAREYFLALLPWTCDTTWLDEMIVYYEDSANYYEDLASEMDSEADDFNLSSEIDSVCEELITIDFAIRECTDHTIPERTQARDNANTDQNNARDAVTSAQNDFASRTAAVSWAESDLRTCNQLHDDYLRDLAEIQAWLAAHPYWWWL